jgi:hypothetical protein
MPNLRLTGEDITFNDTRLPAQALSGQARRYTLPDHMPDHFEERKVCTIIVRAPGTVLTAQWCNPGQHKSVRRRPMNTRGVSKLLFDATVNSPGKVEIYASVARNYNAHWVMWLEHNDAVPWRWRCVWGMDNHIYRQRLYSDVDGD